MLSSITDEGGEYMPTGRKTSKVVAKKAAKLLKKKQPRKVQKSVAASALSQRGSAKRRKTKRK